MVLETTKALLVSALLWVAASAMNVALAAQDPKIDPACLAVAQAYFAALESGDRQALLRMFAGRSLHRNRAQLSDPAYTGFLTNRYANARFEVINGGSVSGVKYVDVTIWINQGQETVKERLYFKPSGNSPTGSLRIVARKELLD